MPRYSNFSGTAWPTISLFLTTTIIYFLTLDTNPSYPITSKRVLLLALHAICCYAQFTVMHDASHGSISTSSKWVNSLFGWLSQVWMGPTANFYAFRHIHKQHHKYTNDPTLDPDYWVSHSSKRFNFLRWFFVDAGYWYFYIPQVWPFGWPWVRVRPKKEVAIVWLYHLSIIFLIAMSIRHNFFYLLLWNWFLPSRISKFILAFAFDFLPHYKIFTTPNQNKYLTTRYLDFSPLTRPFATLVMFYQNYHISHHINPSDPFYMYKKHFETHEEKLRDMYIRIAKIV